jgi:hypothetical protein
MEDYLKEFGISPREFGIERFIKNKTPAESSEREKQKINPSSGLGRDRFSKTELKNLPLTMAYVPFQSIEGTYSNDEALKMGTLFPNLDKPFLGRMP